MRKNDNRYLQKGRKKFGHVFVVDDKSRDNSKIIKKGKIDFKQNKINLDMNVP